MRQRVRDEHLATHSSPESNVFFKGSQHDRSTFLLSSECCLYRLASDVRLMSVHISVQMLFPVGLCALTGRLIQDRDEETAVLVLCVWLPQGLNQRSHPGRSYARENLSNVR